MKPEGPLPRQEISGVYEIWCSCGQSIYVGDTGRVLNTRIAEDTAAVWRNDANSQVATYSTRPGHTFRFHEAETLAIGDNRMSREIIESWFTVSQSINKCNDLPNPYSVLSLNSAKTSRHLGNAQATAKFYAKTEEPDGRAIITPNSTTRDVCSAGQGPHSSQRASNAQEGNYR
ncbi:unnamed protein product [Dibothriocephalus latus]|uniref:GIY-YIG domain-containing protein n=1 Tax=Dibothriocephalus latus TaxID=60516 RepID=A0A3P7NNB5_DIBLA|nr:unnamed protein product [Dibothriocephalus latus]